MKQLVCLTCCVLLLVVGFTQPASLCISKDKTTSLIFPFAIRHVDRGTKDVLVQQIKEADNILLVKAAIENFPETNLSVVTNDGSVYSFVVNFDNKPPVWIYHLPTNQKETVTTYANGILDNSKTMNGIKDNSWDILAEVAGIYIKDDVIYYQIKLINNSAIDYDIDLLRFYIGDKKKGKRTAVQENELPPLYVAGNTKQIKGTNQNTLAVALKKFTIPDAKYLGIQIMEKNGGRHLFLKVSNKKIVKATPLPDLR